MKPKKPNPIEAPTASTIPVHCSHLRLADVTTLVANPRNPNKHSDKQVALLAKVIQHQGWRSPITISKRSGFVVTGHGRLAAALLLQVEFVPIDEQDFATEADEWAHLVADNRLAELADADRTMIADLLGELDAGGLDMDLTGFDMDALEELLAETNPPNITEDEVPDVPVDPITKLGDLWILGEHRVLCGDSTNAEDVGRLMAGEKWRLCVTSPPYNQKLDSFKASGMHTETKWVKNVQHGSYFDSKPENEYQSEQIAAVKVWMEQSSVDASIFYNHKNRYREKQVVSPWGWLSQTGLKVRQEIIWKREGSVTQNARMFMPCDERIFWLYCGDDFYFNDSTEHKTWSSVWQINSHKDREESMHGCAFPMELASRPIRACSKSGDVVLEPYCGSGTTLIAAEQLGRKCYGIEISPAYCDVIVKRWENLTKKQAVLCND